MNRWKNSNSLDSLTRHQIRVQQLVKKSLEYKPSFHINAKYNRQKEMERIAKRMEDRQRQRDQLFKQNMDIIIRIESTQPKVNTKQFPVVKPNPQKIKILSKKQANPSASMISLKRRFKFKDPYRNDEQLFEQNYKLITQIECVGPTVKCWTSRKASLIKDTLFKRKKQQKELILQKFKQIGQELRKLKSIGRASSNKSIQSINSIKSAKSRRSFQTQQTRTK